MPFYSDLTPASASLRPGEEGEEVSLPAPDGPLPAGSLWVAKCSCGAIVARLLERPRPEDPQVACPWCFGDRLAFLNTITWEVETPLASLAAEREKR
jgi:hypothetical protein